MELCRWFVRGLGIACLALGGISLGVGVVSLAASVAYAQTSTVSSIVVQGNQRVEADTIRSYFRAGPNGQLDAFQIDEGVKALFATGLFQDVRPTMQGGRLTITVIENPVINRIAFEGNKKVKDEQLKAEIQSKERGTLSRPVVQADTARLVEVYRRSGRFDIRVDPKIIELPNNRVDLVFEITEGAKTGVRQIEFVGNRAYSSYRLKDVIKTSTTGLLAFLQTGDIYDPDRVEADRELLRRFYLKHGYIDVRVVSAVGEYDPTLRGFVIVFTIEEGDQYRVGTAEVQSSIRALDPALLRWRLRTYPGDVYNAEAVEKTVEDMTIEAAKLGFAFATVRPRATRDPQTRTVNLVFAVEEGQRAYIERINVRGNTRTRDYVIRREFDLAEGDAYNRALVNRAERRLKNLSYFKSVKISTEPGSAPDRVILNVDVEEQSTGEFSVSGGYSTADGFLGEVSVAERNLLGRGLFGKIAVQYGQYTRGAQVSFVDPYFLGYRVALGLDLFYKQQNPTSYVSYQTQTIGFGSRLGFALREDLGLQLRYSLYQQRVTLPPNLMNCNNINPDFVNTFPTAGSVGTTPALTPPIGFTGIANCFADGEASLAVKRELAGGPVITSLVGYTLTHNTLDNNKNPTTGTLTEFRQDFAGVGGDVKFVRTSGDVWALSRGGVGRRRRRASARRTNCGMGRGPANARSFPDGREPGPRICARGHWTARPDATPVYRHLWGFARRHVLLGRQPGVPDATLLPAQGHRGQACGVCRRRLALELCRPDDVPRDGRGHLGISLFDPAMSDRQRHACSLVGRRGIDLGFAVRSAPVRLLFPSDEAALRSGAAVPLRWWGEILIRPAGPRFKA